MPKPPFTLGEYVTMHRVAQVRRSERILVHGLAGDMGSALLDWGEFAGGTYNFICSKSPSMSPL